MEQLAKFITDERTGLKYELCGDYYIIAGEDEPEREPIGIWGQRHLKHIQKHCKPSYNTILQQGCTIFAGGRGGPPLRGCSEVVRATAGDS